MGTVEIGHALGDRRVAGQKSVARLAGALALALVPWAAHGEVLAEYDYTVLRGGEPIGTHQVTVSPEGPVTKVEEKTDVEVTFGPLTLFRMEHLRQEVWRDGKLQSITAYTDKNGDVYDMVITREPDGFKRVINGQTDRLAPSVKPLTLWHEDLFKYTTFFSPIDDETFRVSVDFVGAEKLDLVGESVNAFVYRLSGDTNREIWYDADGLIMKVRLLDHDPSIEYVLTSVGQPPAHPVLALPTVYGPHRPVARIAARR